MKFKHANQKSNWNVLVFCDQWKMMSDLNTFYGKCLSFVSFPVFNFTLVMKLRKFDFKSRWNTLIILTKIIYDVSFEYVRWKNVWFSFISIVWVHFTHQTEKLWFWKSLKYFSLFIQKKKKSQIWIWPVKQGLIWFKLLCSSRISAISWEMQILNFTEIVQYFSIKDSYVKVCPGFFVSFVCFELKMFLMILKYSYRRLLS